MRLSGMSSSLFWLHFIVFIHATLLCCLSLLQSGFPVALATFRQGGNETDRLALLAFKAEIKADPFGVISSWNESLHFCQWQGVTCGRRHRRVTMLELESQKLAGSISPHIGNLSFLMVLMLYNNSFTHEIPPELGRLHRLQILRLNNNSISGEIPANISACSELIFLDFSKNSLEGKIPAELGALLKLQQLRINTNNLIGAIPPSFGNLTSLQALLTSKNNLVGSLPNALCQLANLTIIAVGENMLHGIIPPSLFNHSSRMVIDLGTNQIQGTLPPYLGNTLPNLQFFSIFDNEFTGPFPVSISNATNLVTFIVAFNQLTGNVPTLEKLHGLRRLIIAFTSMGSGKAHDLSFLSSLTNATSLEILELNANNFGGVVPESVSNLSTNLVELSLSYNQISGNIPTGICNLVNLEALYFGVNQLTGVIPPEIGKLQKLQELALLDNKFSGTIPSSLGNLTFLTMLSLRVNNLHGSIPSSLGKCQNLGLLEFGQNNLSGTIPQEVLSLSSLSLSLDLSHNHFTGSLPIEVGNLKNLGSLDVSDNKLSGEIPATLGSCVRLESLILQGNLLQGTVPSSFRFLRGIQILDLSFNNLSGVIPEYFEGFKLLHKLNLSFNDLQGPVPSKGIFKNLSAISITGNKQLCGGLPELQLPNCISNGTKKGRSTHSLKLVISTSCGLVGLTLLFCFSFLCWFKRTKNKPNSGSPENSVLNVTYQSLLKATDGFSSVNLIGVGSFGSVYKGNFDLDGTMVAVKVLNLLRRGATKSFIAECEALRNIRHRNLVKVITACSSVDYKGNDFKALVYEFMVHGSLEKWLHPSAVEDSALEECPKLNFVQRINIAVDVACALDYLHHHCQTPIIHCDLKPSNVLLDNELTAHVADFGIARFLPQATQNSSAMQSSSIGVRGSIGYTAPEYGMGSEVSMYGDVYSFGILLLEMFTGKRPTDDLFKDSLNLHNFAKTAFPDRVADIADPILLQERKESSNISDKLEGCLASLLGIGVACSAELARERMNIHDAVAELQSVRDTVLGIGMHGERRTRHAAQ